MKCLDYFYYLMGRRDYSVSELRKKGKEKGFDEDVITNAIDQLQEKGYQSDSRLVENMIMYNKGKYGKAMLKRKCFEKGISADIFEEIWSQQGENNEPGELDGLKGKVMRKYHLDNWQNIDPKTKNKVINYLQYRGFNAFEILKQWQQEELNQLG